MFKTHSPTPAKAWLLITTIVLLVSGCASSGFSGSNKTTYYVYLAGPEVFLPDPIGAGKSKKDLIQRLNATQNWPFELVGLYPMDNEITDFKPDFATGIKIYQANIELMRKADFITANMVRFRGPSMDVGTAFEMGYMAGLDKPVFAYYDAVPFYGEAEPPGLYRNRVKAHYPVASDGEHDIHGQSIENFQMADNLMMIGSMQPANGDIATDFEAAVMQIAAYLGRTNTKR